MFLPLFYSFLGFLEFKNLVEPIFDMRGFTRKNFSSKFWFWEKIMAAPPRSKLVQKIWGCRHVQYLSKILKKGFVFLDNRFRVKDLLLGTVLRIILILIPHYALVHGASLATLKNTLIFTHIEQDFWKCQSDQRKLLLYDVIF